MSVGDDRYLDAAADALERAWPVGGTINQQELHAAVGRILMYLRSEAQAPLNGSMRTLSDGSNERFVVGHGWVAVSAPPAPPE